MYTKFIFLLIFIVLLSPIFAQGFHEKKVKESNIEFVLISNGIFGLEQSLTRGGCYWPRGSQNQYIFGGGFWFGAKKSYIGDSTNSVGEVVLDGNGNPIQVLRYRKMVELSYNPNSGQSWMVPGRFENGDEYVEDNLLKHRVHSSSEFGKNNGEPYDSDLDNWPLWETNKGSNKCGIYIDDVSLRNKTSYPGGPAFRSDEDLFCTYKDTDLNFFEGGTSFRKYLGYPLGLQFEQTLYSWNDEQYKDAIIIMYSVINISEDTLKDCLFASMIDPDIALRTNATAGARNDRARYYQEDPAKNLAVSWTMGDIGEKGRGFGYLGLSLIMTPSVDENDDPDNDDYRFIRCDNSVYDPDSQIGLSSYRNWPLLEDKKEDNDRYEFMASRQLDGDDEAGDKRLMMSTGPFNMRPGDTARVALLINIALPVNAEEASGKTEELTTLVNNATLAKERFYNDILRPVSVEETTHYNDISIISNTFPNPATENITVEFNLKTPATPIFEIINTLGETVVKINNESFGAGSNIVNIDTKSLASGSYYLKISVGAYQEVRMISVVR